MDRIVEISNFRNLRKATLELNYNIENGNGYGGVVILIGPNNCGKSNVLDAIEAGYKKVFSEKDSPSYRGEDELKPCVNIKYRQTTKNEKSSSLPTDRRIFYNELSGETKNYVEENKLDSNNPQKLYRYIEETKEKYGNAKGFGIPNNVYDELEIFCKSFRFPVKTEEETNKNVINDFRVIRYQEKGFSSKNFDISRESFDKSEFLKAITKLTGYDFKNLVSDYNYFDKHDYGDLGEVEKEINHAIKKISDDFNKIYSFGDSFYSFEIKLQQSGLIFAIYQHVKENGKAYRCWFDEQSTGFKWFFNFYFEVLGSKGIKKGDIVLLDEPANNIHVSGIVELMDFLRDFSLNTGVTFVISTHSPFMIDLDRLDEIRIVEKEDKYAKIQNKFTDIGENNKDVLYKVVGALTVGRHIVLNPESTLCFVEGITDYNYLIAMKHVLKYEGVSFVPFNGVGNKDDIYSFPELLMQIDRHPNVLVDGDFNGSKCHESLKAYKIENVVSISEILPGKVVIEDLFENDDKDLINIGNKSYKYSLSIKNEAFKNKLSFDKETLNNFKQLFDHILKEFE